MAYRFRGDAQRTFWQRLGTGQSARLVTQVAIAAFLAYTAILHLGAEAAGSLAPSAEAFCPMGGIETLYTWISSGGQFISHTHLSNLVVLAALVVAAVALKSAFCGWICPLGALQEWLHGVGSWLGRVVPPLARARRAISWAEAPGPGSTAGRFARWWNRIDHGLRYARYAVLAWVVASAAAYTVMVFRDYDPFAALLGLAELSLTAGTVVLGVVALASLVVERPWCRWFCPLSPIVGWAGKPSPFKVERDPQVCKTCRLCQDACPVSLPIATMRRVTETSCQGCLACTAACPRPGALTASFRVPLLPGRRQAAGPGAPLTRAPSARPLLLGLAAVALFLGTIQVAQATGLWSTSGKVTATGEKVLPAGIDVAEIKGWMTLGEVAAAYGVSMDEIVSAFALPADTSARTELRQLESEQFSVTNLRDWLRQRGPAPPPP